MRVDRMFLHQNAFWGGLCCLLCNLAVPLLQCSTPLLLHQRVASALALQKDVLRGARFVDA